MMNDDGRSYSGYNFFCGMMMIGTKDAQGSGGGAGERERDIEEGSGDPA